MSHPAIDCFHDPGEPSDDTRLPTSTYQDAPYAFADVDDNGTRDVILTAYDNGVRSVFIFWNGTDTYSAGKLDTEAASAFPFDPPPLLNPHGNMPGDMQDSGEIMDVVAINLDGDRFKELAVLTQDHVYLLKLALQDPEAEKPELAPDRSLQWFSPNGQPFANVRGGQALLAIDADSDGIEDLLVADTGKLLLYFGTERL